MNTKINGEIQRQPGIVMMNTSVDVLMPGKNQSPAEFLLLGTYSFFALSAYFHKVSIDTCRFYLNLFERG